MALTGGGSRVDFSFTSVANLALARIPNNRSVNVQNGQRYVTSSVDAGGGILLASGNYANTIESIDVVLPVTVGGTLTTGGQINQIRDSGAFTMPLANSVAANVILVVELPDTFNAQTPTLTRSGSDLFRNKLGTDTVIEWSGAARLTLTSNGIDEWEL